MPMIPDDPEDGPRYASRRRNYSRNPSQRSFSSAGRFGERRPLASTDHFHARGARWWLAPGVRFRIAGFPITFSWSVLVFLLLPVSWWLQGSGIGLVMSLGVFGAIVVSIVVHELGHALVARRYGLAPIAVSIHGLGGFASYRQTPDRGQRIAIALAGPGAGLLLAGVAAAGAWAIEASGPLAYVDGLLYWTARAGVLWSGLNLLPIRPLDGGSALTSLLHQVAPGWAMPLTWGIGLAVAVVGAGVALALGEWVIALLGLYLAFDNGRGLWRWWSADRKVG